MSFETESTSSEPSPRRSHWHPARPRSQGILQYPEFAWLDQRNSIIDQVRRGHESRKHVGWRVGDSDCSSTRRAMSSVTVGKELGELFECVIVLEIIEERFHRHARSTKHRRAAKDVRVIVNHSSSRIFNKLAYQRENTNARNITVPGVLRWFQVVSREGSSALVSRINRKAVNCLNPSSVVTNRGLPDAAKAAR